MSTVQLPPLDALSRLIHSDADDRDEDERQDDEDEQLLAMVEGKETDYLALQSSISASTALLSELGEFLGSFREDLERVGGELRDLRERSEGVERRGGGRRTISTPLSLLLPSITLPPALITTLSQTQPSEAWFGPIETLHGVLEEVARRRGRVKAAGEVESVAGELKNLATSKIRLFLLTLFKPLTTSVTLNLPILQSSLLRWRPLYLFLLAHAPGQAGEVRRAYGWRVRGYYETAFRRYARFVGVVAARNTDPYDLLSSTPSAGALSTDDPLGPSLPPPTVAGSSTTSSTSASGLASGSASGTGMREIEFEPQAVLSARVEGEGVLLAWQADDKAFRMPVEALFRSLLLVLVDNASSEWAFDVRFFSPPLFTLSNSVASLTSAGGKKVGGGGARERFGSATSTPARAERLPSTVGVLQRERVASFAGARLEGERELERAKEAEGEDAGKEGGKDVEELWTWAFGPALESVQAQITALLTPVPSPAHLLPLLSLLSALVSLSSSRGLSPLLPFLLKQRLAIWPLFQRRMDGETEGLKALEERARPGGGGLMGMLGGSQGSKVKDAKVQKIAEKYAHLFNVLSALASAEDGPMIRMSLKRLRAPLDKLIVAQASKLPEGEIKEAFLESIYDRIVGVLRRGGGGEDGWGEDEVRFWKARLEGGRP